jgi:hypothetical protein
MIAWKRKETEIRKIIRKCFLHKKEIDLVEFFFPKVEGVGIYLVCLKYVC